MKRDTYNRATTKLYFDVKKEHQWTPPQVVERPPYVAKRREPEELNPNETWMV